MPYACRYPSVYLYRYFNMRTDMFKELRGELKESSKWVLCTEAHVDMCHATMQWLSRVGHCYFRPSKEAIMRCKVAGYSHLTCMLGHMYNTLHAATQLCHEISASCDNASLVALRAIIQAACRFCSSVPHIVIAHTHSCTPHACMHAPSGSSWAPTKSCRWVPIWSRVGG